jgi:hypothetical protein
MGDGWRAPSSHFSFAEGLGRSLESCDGRYRTCVIGPDGHIINRVDLSCVMRMRRDGSQHRADRFIERFEPALKTPL